MQIVWTKGARADLVEIAREIAQDRPDTARAVVNRIRSAVGDLSTFPELGRIVPELGDPSVRERIVRPYRAIYRLGEDRVEVLAVVHGRRLVGQE